MTVEVEREPFGSRDVIGSVTIVGRDQLRNESVNEPLDLLRRRKAERSHVTQDIDEEMSDTLAGDSACPLDTAQASQQARALHNCLVQLENRQREVVSLAYIRDLSHTELAEQLKLPLGTVKTWIRRGLDQLRTCMSRFA